jgi:hypothetical protein
MKTVDLVEIAFLFQGGFVGRVSNVIYNKYYIEYMHPNGYKCREYYNKYPINRYVGIDRNIYVPKLTEKGTSLIALKHSKTDKQVKK